MEWLAPMLKADSVSPGLPVWKSGPDSSVLSLLPDSARLAFVTTSSLMLVGLGFSGLLSCCPFGPFLALPAWFHELLGPHTLVCLLLSVLTLITFSDLIHRHSYKNQLRFPRFMCPAPILPVTSGATHPITNLLSARKCSPHLLPLKSNCWFPPVNWLVLWPVPPQSHSSVLPVDHTENSQGTSLPRVLLTSHLHFLQNALRIQPLLLTGLTTLLPVLNIYTASYGPKCCPGPFQSTFSASHRTSFCKRHIGQ